MSGNNKFIKFLKDRGFYIALSLCIIGSAGAAWATANKTINSIREHNNIITEEIGEEEEKPWEDEAEGEIILPPKEELQKVDTPVTDVPLTPPSSSQESSLPQEQPEESEPVIKEQLSEPKSEQSPYILPLAYPAVIEPFSKGELVKNCTLNVWRVHNGIDLKGEKGDNVLAVSDGVVINIHNDPLWGGCIEIKHPDGCTSSYCGVKLDKNIKTGENVAVGELLGTLSDIPAEADKGIHLHFEMHRSNRACDPSMYLPVKADF